jgi:ADP-ribose pyrophosphatase YjhB (NUDIX family)
MAKYKYCPLCAHPLQVGWVESRQRSYCPQCDFIHYENPLPTVVALGLLDDQILLIQRGLEPRKGLWTLPSGFIEKGESPENACLRELLEESGMTGQIQQLIGVYHVDSSLYGDLISLIYYVHLNPGHPIAGDDAADAALVPVSQVTDLGFVSFNHAFQQFIANREE